MTETASFTAEEQDALARIAGLIIPASAEFGIPGADDPAIFADLVATAAPHCEALRTALAGFELATDDGARFRTAFPEEAGLIQSLVVQCYYRDDRVMRSLDMEVRPPFPLGFQIDQGDWSLLDPVKKRAPLYREVP